jgi:hypothetical protein
MNTETHFMDLIGSDEALEQPEGSFYLPTLSIARERRPDIRSDTR